MTCSLVLVVEHTACSRTTAIDESNFTLKSSLAKTPLGKDIKSGHSSGLLPLMIKWGVGFSTIKVFQRLFF